MRPQLEWNDNLPEEEPPPEPTWVPPAPPPKAYGKGPPLQTSARERQRAKGHLPGRTVIESARRRGDHKALRASDGAVLKFPYVVRLKSAAPPVY